MQTQEWETFSIFCLSGVGRGHKSSMSFINENTSFLPVSLSSSDACFIAHCPDIKELKIIRKQLPSHDKGLKTFILLKNEGKHQQLLKINCNASLLISTLIRAVSFCKLPKPKILISSNSTINSRTRVTHSLQTQLPCSMRPRFVGCSRSPDPEASL